MTTSATDPPALPPINLASSGHALVCRLCGARFVRTVGPCPGCAVALSRENLFIAPMHPRRRQAHSERGDRLCWPRQALSDRMDEALPERQKQSDCV